MAAFAAGFPRLIQIGRDVSEIRYFEGRQGRHIEDLGKSASNLECHPSFGEQSGVISR
jgi:hypothetical protein